MNRQGRNRPQTTQPNEATAQPSEHEEQAPRPQQRRTPSTPTPRAGSTEGQQEPTSGRTTARPEPHRQTSDRQQPTEPRRQRNNERDQTRRNEPRRPPKTRTQRRTRATAGKPSKTPGRGPGVKGATKERGRRNDDRSLDAGVLGRKGRAVLLAKTRGDFPALSTHGPGLHWESQGGPAWGVRGANSKRCSPAAGRQSARARRRSEARSDDGRVATTEHRSARRARRARAGAKARRRGGRRFLPRPENLPLGR
jgi:hypothetical protein